MAIPFPSYSKIRNRYCIVYYGPCADYILQLLYLRPAIEKELPGLEIYICFKEKFAHLAKERVIFSEELNHRKREFAYIRELKCDLQQHPVWQMIQESNLSLNALETPAIKPCITHNCVICSKAIFPTQPIHNIEAIKLWSTNQGFQTIVSDNISKADWVIGPENEQLFTAAIQGTRTTLIPTGLGTALYKKMFPYAEILQG